MGWQLRKQARLLFVKVVAEHGVVLGHRDREAEHDGPLPQPQVRQGAADRASGVLQARCEVAAGRDVIGCEFGAVHRIDILIAQVRIGLRERRAPRRRARQADHMNTIHTPPMSPCPARAVAEGAARRAQRQGWGKL